MSKLLITTQVRENYGAHDWDGQGACPQYWKCKGGSDYVVLDIDVNKASDVYAAVQSKCEQHDDYYVESVIDWEVVADDYLTYDERDQVEYDGKITYPAKQLAA